MSLATFSPNVEPEKENFVYIAVSNVGNVASGVSKRVPFNVTSFNYPILTASHAPRQDHLSDGPTVTTYLINPYVCNNQFHDKTTKISLRL